MKFKNLKYSAILLLGFWLAGLHAQNLDRVALSSGGISSDTLNATIGEIFVFSVNSDGISLTAGSQGDIGNTGGIPTNIAQLEFSQKEILVYPNPVVDVINLQINGLKSDIVSFQVFDARGKIVFQQTKTSIKNIFQIQVSQLAAGQYYISGYSFAGEYISDIKFIKL